MVLTLIFSLQIRRSPSINRSEHVKVEEARHTIIGRYAFTENGLITKCIITNKLCDTLELFFDFVKRIIKDKFPVWAKKRAVMMKIEIIFKENYCFITPWVEFFPFYDIDKWFENNIPSVHPQGNNPPISLTFHVYHHDPLITGIQLQHRYNISKCFKYDSEMYVQLEPGYILHIPKRLRRQYDKIENGHAGKMRLYKNRFNVICYDITLIYRRHDSFWGSSEQN